jgi:hypothetical protein
MLTNQEPAMRVYALVVVLAGLLATGCARKFTYERYSMIQPGTDDREGVREVLGKPHTEAGDEWYYQDLDHHIHARIFFDESGRVVDKEWMDAKRGTWEGKHPAADEPPPGEVRERKTKARRIDEDQGD